ncbi:MAG TPA: aldose epimerase family protein [Polyangia bacterium]|nr:aldose epimerase family protein [Polyangia bacterium]
MTLSPPPSLSRTAKHSNSLSVAVGAAALAMLVGHLPASARSEGRKAQEMSHHRGKTGAAVPIQKAPYGQVDGQAVDLYTLTNSMGMVAKITNYGAIVTELLVPDRKGELGDVVLGFDKVGDYVEKSPYFGAIVGRVANRIANATFELEGKTYKLAANNAPHHLHGGKKGWDKVIWTAEPKETPKGPSLKLTHVSPDGEEGYPGTVTATATYTLTNDGALEVQMEATTDKTTLINMAHHSYWNLAGSGTILDQELTIDADKYTPGDPMVPNGKVVAVKGTPFDFTTQKPIGRDLKAAGGKPVGFDHNWVVNGDLHTLRRMARLKDPKSGRVLTLLADQPGLQFYTGNYLDGSNKGKGGAVQVQYAGLCLESQKFPNSVNVPAWREEVILKPGKTYRHTMIHRFTTE